MWPLSDTQLERLRHEADPAADELIAHLQGAGDVAALNHVLRAAADGGQPAKLPPAVAAWLERTGRLPTWVDPERLDRGAALFRRHGVAIFTILGTASLVDCYACKKGVQVLTFTHRLDQDPYRRIGETMQFVLDVLAPGALRPGGPGLWAVQRVRLMHAGIRWRIRRSGRWDERRLGLPICQEDLLGTLMTFSYTIVQGLRRLGIRVKVGEVEDFLHLWRAVGELLGIRPEILPRSMRAAAQVTAAIFRRHQGPSAAGVKMTRALLEMYAAMTPGRALDGVAPAVTRYLVGRRVADWLKVPRSGWDAVAERAWVLGWLADHLLGRRTLVRRLVERLGVAVLTAGAVALAGYQRAGFAVPAELRQAWGL